MNLHLELMETFESRGEELSTSQVPAVLRYSGGEQRQPDLAAVARRGAHCTPPRGLRPRRRSPPWLAYLDDPADVETFCQCVQVAPTRLAQHGLRCHTP